MKNIGRYHTLIFRFGYTGRRGRGLTGEGVGRFAWAVATISFLVSWDAA